MLSKMNEDELTIEAQPNISISVPKTIKFLEHDIRGKFWINTDNSMHLKYRFGVTICNLYIRYDIELDFKMDPERTFGGWHGTTTAFYTPRGSDKEYFEPTGEYDTIYDMIERAVKWTENHYTNLVNRCIEIEEILYQKEEKK